MLEDTDPVTVAGNQLRLAQTCFVTEAELQSTSPFDPGAPSGASDPAEFSSGNGIRFDNEGLRSEYPRFTVDYLIESENVGFAYRGDDEGAGGSDEKPIVEVRLLDADTDTVVNTVQIQSGTFIWAGFPNDEDPDGYDDIDPPFGAGSEEWDGPDIGPGEYYFALESTTDGEDADDATLVDIFALFDTRFDYVFDDTTNGSSGYLDGPGLYPDVAQIVFEEIDTRRNVSEATANMSWTDTTGGQYIQVSNDETNWVPDDGTQDNTESVTAAFPSEETGVTVRVGMSRYPQSTNPQNDTPRFGYDAQAIDSFELFTDPRAINPDGTGEAIVTSIVPPNQIDGETIREAAQLTESEEALTRSIFAEFTVQEDERLQSDESITFDGA